MIPNYQSLMLPILRFLGDGQEKHLRGEEAKSFIKKEFNLSEEDMQMYYPPPSIARDTILVNRMDWARSHLGKAGLVKRSEKKGYWKITDAGQQLLQKNLPEINNKILKEGHLNLEKTQARNIDLKENESEVLSPGEQFEAAYSTLRDSLKDNLLEQLRTINPYMLERIVIDLLVKMGYGGLRSDMAQVTQKSADGGIDGVIKEDCLGLDMIYIQAKRWQTSVGRPEIQQFCGAMNHKGVIKGVFVTTSSFTKDAKEFAESLSNQRIRLIDGKYLADLMIEYNLGVSVKAVYEIKEVDDNYFDPN